MKCSDIIDANGYLDFGRAVMVPRPARFPVRYDYTCKIMKARYNCAHEPKRKDVASDWILGFNSTAGNVCLMKDLLHMSGGIESVSRHIERWSHRNISDHKTHILLTGNSYMRQIFEAIVCNYHSEHGLIKSVEVALGGPEMNMRSLLANPKLEISDLGVSVDLGNLTGCHASTNITQWYESSVSLPPDNAECRDDVARVEIANMVFYYVFRPYAYRNMSQIFTARGWNASTFDVIVSNENKATDYMSSFVSNKIRVINIASMLPYFHTMQMEQLHKWFGADNVGIYNVPDGHACMPGVPDDEVDTLLFMLRHKVQGLAWTNPTNITF